MSLHRKILKDKAARKWLRQNQAEFPLSSILPQSRSFRTVRLFDTKFVNDCIADALKYGGVFTRYERTVAHLFLQIPPREIAKELGRTRSSIYETVRNLKAKAIAAHKARNEALINGRDEKLTPEGGLDAHPSDVAIKTRRLETAGGKVAFVYLVERDQSQVWVDEQGQAFPAEVQEHLSNFDEDVGPEAEGLSMEEW